MRSYRRVKLGCYSVNVTMSVVGNLSPILFLTFHSLYDISFSLLGTLVLLNFFTQLCVDLVFSFFSHRFNIQKAVKITPVLALIGFFIFAMAPFWFAGNIFLGLAIGTVIFSSASGFAEVLISPVIAAIPAENPEREMSKLHSVYAWGVVGVILYATLFLLLFDATYWWVLTLTLMAVPLAACVLLFGARLPRLETPERATGALSYLKKPGVLLCVLAIFLGGAAECTMAQWSSSYLEAALGIPKVWGDIFGVALFGMMLGLGRTLYSKCGKALERVLFLGACGALVCYLTAALSGVPLLGLLACALTGFCVSMLWPGSLSVASERYPEAGVFIFAIMAAGGDLGASLGPQLVGIITDKVSASPKGTALALRLGQSAEQIGMRAGLLVGAVFSLVAVAIFAIIWRQKRKNY